MIARIHDFVLKHQPWNVLVRCFLSINRGDGVRIALRTLAFSPIHREKWDRSVASPTCSKFTNARKSRGRSLRVGCTVCSKRTHVVSAKKSRFTDSHRRYVRTRTEIRRGSSPLCRSSADGRRAFSMPKQEQIRQGILWRRGCGVWMGQPAVRHLNFKFEANRDINAENSCIIFGTTIYTSLPRTKWYIQDQSLWKNRRIPIGRF